MQYNLKASRPLVGFRLLMTTRYYYDQHVFCRGNLSLVMVMMIVWAIMVFMPMSMEIASIFKGRTSSKCRLVLERHLE